MSTAPCVAVPAGFSPAARVGLVRDVASSFCDAEVSRNAAAHIESSELYESRGGRP